MIPRGLCGREPQNEKLPDPWHDQFTPLQRMLVVRALRPDKVVPAITDYVGVEMGKRYVEPQPFNLSACYDDSSAGYPLVFVLSAGADPMANLLKFAESKNNMRVEARPRAALPSTSQIPQPEHTVLWDTGIRCVVSAQPEHLLLWDTSCGFSDKKTAEVEVKRWSGVRPWGEAVSLGQGQGPFAMRNIHEVGSTPLLQPRLKAHGCGS